jgi:hypothetical protein
MGGFFGDPLHFLHRGSRSCDKRSLRDDFVIDGDKFGCGLFWSPGENDLALM